MTILACIVLGLGSFVIAAYWCAVFSVPRGRHVSPVPLIGGGLAFAGCALLPMIGWKLGLIAIVVDPGCWLIAFPIMWLGDWIRARAVSAMPPS